MGGDVAARRVHNVKAGELRKWFADVFEPEADYWIRSSIHAAAMDFASDIKSEAVAEAGRRDLVHKKWYIRGFQVKGTTVENDSVYAGVIELGRTPGAKKPPREPIMEWVIDKINPPADEVDEVVEAIREKISERPLPPQFILRDAPTSRAALVKLRAAVRKHLLEWGISRGGTRPPRGRVRGARYVPR